MDAFRMGDERAFKHVFNTYHQRLTLYAAKLTAYTPEAEDIAVKCFNKTFKKHNNFLHLKHLESFMYTVVHNDCMNFLTNRSRTNRVLKEYGTLQNCIQNPDADISKVEQIEQVYSQLHKLPPKNQLIVQLFLEGFSYKEIARQQNTSTDNVIHHVHNAAKKLRKLLKHTLVCA